MIVPFVVFFVALYIVSTKTEIYIIDLHIYSYSLVYTKTRAMKAFLYSFTKTFSWLKLWFWRILFWLYARAYSTREFLS